MKTLTKDWLREKKACPASILAVEKSAFNNVAEAVNFCLPIAERTISRFLDWENPCRTNPKDDITWFLAHLFGLPLTNTGIIILKELKEYLGIENRWLDCAEVYNVCNILRDLPRERYINAIIQIAERSDEI
jgi:hypothetical protein